MKELVSWLAVTLTDRQSISDLAGSASFTIWLFAQSPQLFENYRRGSVEGLSPVFLIQWMLGDATNLIGCVLTGQLPFQIAVATYFCCVDLCIMVQYCYYWRKARASLRRTVKAIARPARSRMGSLVSYQPAVHPFALGPTETSELLPSSSRRRHERGSRSPTLARGHSSRPPMSRKNSEDMEGSHHSQTATYRALRDAAMSVAQLADEAARRREAAGYFDGVHSHHHHSHHCHHHHSHNARHQHDHHHAIDRSHSHHGSRRGPDGPSMSRSSSRHSFARPGERSRTHSTRRNQSTTWTPVTLSPTNEVRPLDSDSDDGGEEVPNSLVQSVASLQSNTSTASSASVTSRVDQQVADLTHSIDDPADRRGRDMTRTAIRLGLIADAAEGSPSPTPSDGTAKCAGRQTTPSGVPRNVAGPSESNRKVAVAAETQGDEGDGAKLHDETRDDVTDGHDAAFKRRATRSGSRPSKSRARSSHSVRRGFGMALMGLMMVVALAEGPAGAFTQSTPVGGIGPSSVGQVARQTVRLVLEKLRHPASVYLASLRSIASVSSTGLDMLGTPPISPTPPSGPAWDRIIGRMSAWTCTVLYMTSRLPQIWENYLRRSVAGLSILLFIAAFLGNLTYSISILVSPAAVGDRSKEYLQECLPFLLGSGGTLIFDFIIVVQWWMWAGKEDGTAAGIKDQRQLEEVHVGSSTTGRLGATMGTSSTRANLDPGKRRRRRRRESIQRSWEDRSASLGAQPMSSSVVAVLPSHPGVREEAEDEEQQRALERMTRSVPGLS